MTSKFFRMFLVLALFLIFSGIVIYALSSYFQPQACNGQWTNCVFADINDANRATASVTKNSQISGTWNNYGINIPNSNTINSVVMRADFFASQTTGFINVKVSADGGTTFGPAHTVGGNTAEQSFFIDVTSEQTWTGSKLNNTNFRVNVTCFKSGGGSNPTCNLDWIPVNVTYTVPPTFDFSVSANPSNASVVQGGSASTTATVTLLSGNSTTVTLSQTGCPTNAICSFNQTSGIPTYSAAFTVSTNASTPLGTYPINISGSGNGLTRSAVYTLNVTV